MVYAVGYVRVSTGEQYATPDVQAKEIRDVCTKKGWELLDICYDIDVSGSIYPMNRRGFRRCVEKLKDVGGGVIVAYALDRVARIDTGDFTKLVEELSALNIRLYFVREESVIHIILSNPLIGKMVLQNIQSYAEIERELISDRVRMAFKNPRVRHRFEQRFEEKTGLVLTKNVPGELKQRVIELRKRGATIREIAKETGLSTYKVLKILAEANLVQRKQDTCPRCFSKLVVKNILGYVKVYYCRKCGFKNVEVVEI